MDQKKIGWGFIGRFTLLHLLTYTACGIVFMFVSNYAGELTSPEMAAYMRPVDDPLVALGIPMQVLRGALLALALVSFRLVFLEGRWGWFKLWAVLWVLTSIGAVIAGPGSLEGLVYTRFGFGSLWVGYPEITCQTLVFAWLFTAWEQRVARRLARPVMEQASA